MERLAIAEITFPPDMPLNTAPCHEALGQVLIQMGRTAEGETHLRQAQAYDR